MILHAIFQTLKSIFNAKIHIKNFEEKGHIFHQILMPGHVQY